MFKLSSEASLDGVVAVENKFIVEYMPYADGDYVKVYLYGLSLSARKDDSDDTVERLARRLDLDRATVDAAIEYWSDLGLMSRLGDDVSYLPVRSARPKVKKIDVDKYREFNRITQQYIKERQVAPNEFNEYYSIMEKLNIEWQAMLGIVKYCVDLKGANVSAPYILAVARNLASEGYRTAEEVENRLEEYSVYYGDLLAVLSCFGHGKRPDHESMQLYKNWRVTLKFDKEVILHVAQTIKRGGTATLDTKLQKYAEMGLFTADKIDEYEAARAKLYKLVKAINKALGVYYENVDPEIGTYINPWLELGFDGDALLCLAEHCMKNGLKTLSDMDAIVRDFFAAGCVTTEKIAARIEGETGHDKAIAAVMQKLGIIGAVKPGFRAFYSVWADKWGMPEEVIMYGAERAAGKSFAYLNAVLSAWHDMNVTDVEQAKAHASPTNQNGGQVNECYSAEQLNSMFTTLNDEDN